MTTTIERPTPSSTAQGDAVAQTRRRRRRPQGNGWAIWFLLPAGFFLFFSVIVPSIQGAVYAFTDWNGLTTDWEFVGFENFLRMTTDPFASTAVVNTLLLTAITLVGQNVIGILLALALNSQIKGRRFMRVIVFAPAVVTPLVIANLWRFILMPEGPLNSVLDAVGLGWAKQIWLGDPDLVIWSISFVILWQMSGVIMVIYIAGLQNVPDELLEAAALDGAGPVRRFFSVSLPALRPAIVVSTLICVIGGLKTFDQVWVMTRGGPGVSSQVMSTAIYQAAFLRGEFAYSTAIALVLTVICVIAAIIQQRVTRARKDG